MPEKRVVDKFKIKDGFDADEYLKKKIDEARQMLLTSLDEAYSIQNRVFRNICMFSLIDCLAQEYKNYPSYNSTEAFCDFVLEFQDFCNYLDAIEPVTLFYDYEPHINTIVRYPELQEIEPSLCGPELEITIDKLRIDDETKVEEIIGNSFSSELLNIIKRDKGEKTADQYRKRHTMIRLLYKMRSKAVHELSHIGGENKWEMQDGIDKPFYRDLSRLYKHEDNIVNDNIIELVIPSKFIYELSKNVIDNYLKDCSKNKRLPFENNRTGKRDVVFTWND